MNYNLLLVDDEPNIPRAIKRALRGQGYNIRLANSGVDALAIFEQHPIDIIVSDQRMPGMSGAELLSTVREKYPDTVRIMLSGHADLGELIEAINEGSIYKYLTKPWANDTLRAVLSEAAAKLKPSVSNPDEDKFLHALSETASSACLVLLEVRNLSAIQFLPSDHHDELQAVLNARIEDVVGHLDVPVHRLQSGLYAFVCSGLEKSAAKALIEALNHPFDVAGQIIPLRMAMAYAKGSSGLAPEEWLQQATIALGATSFSGQATPYSAKIKGDLQERFTLEQDMRTGLAQGEFFLQVQPQVCGSSLAIRGAEALCRWRHPERGLISPLQFIDLAERNGFIHELGSWVVRESCNLLRMLKERNIDDIKISFNVSPRQFTLEGWKETVLEFANDPGIQTGNIVIEITESTVMSNPDRAKRIMSELRSAGIRLAMDDFGTGHSSLGLINDLPVDSLKFDRALIQNVTLNERSRTLFSRLVEMTHELGLESVAEGVETTDQVRLCQALKCDLIQGFAFHRPVSVADFFELLEAGRSGKQ